MIKIISTLLAVASISILAACSESPADAGTTSSTTEVESSAVDQTAAAVDDGVEAAPDVDMSTVEAAFATNLDRKGENITQGEPNASLTIDNVDCQQGEGNRALCYVTETVSVGTYEETKHYSWNVTYDTEDGHPLAYHPR